MKNYSTIRKFCFIYVLCFVYISLTFADTLLENNITVGNSVEHKNQQLDLYLDLIRYNTQEKIGILPYILKNKQGIYLEIGTGGDPIAKMLSKIPLTSNTTLIASDIEPTVLKALPKRHPELQPYLDAQQGVQLKLEQLDATDMSMFKNDFFDGINASSLVHEIFSYAGGFEGIRSFFKEAFRTLKIGGVLIYRDPECVAHKKQPVILSLKNKNIRLFAHIFLYKFLDSRGSALANSGCKVKVYNPEEVKFTIFKKGSLSPIVLTYEEYLNVPSYDIDFSREYTIALPCGLYRELARHYLTYLHQCNPLSYVKCTPNIIQEQYDISYFAHSTNSLLSMFLNDNEKSFKEKKISLKQKIKLDQEIEAKTHVLEFGIPLCFTSSKEQCKLRKLLEKYSLLPSSYIISISDNSCLLDYRIFGLLYDEINTIIGNGFNDFLVDSDVDHAKWLKREGEEFYFYFSADELITEVLQTTQSELIDDQGNKTIFVLCPFAKDKNEFIERNCYSEILNNSMQVCDLLGYPIKVIDGKRVVHFSKMTLNSAITICKNIIKKSPMDYVKLQTYLESLSCNKN